MNHTLRPTGANLRQHLLEIIDAIEVLNLACRDLAHATPPNDVIHRQAVAMSDRTEALRARALLTFGEARMRP